MSRTFTFVLAASLALAGQPALAQAWKETADVQFRYDRDASVKANYRSVKRTAKRFCFTAGVKSASVYARERKCINDMVDQAVALFGRPDLAGLHIAQTGRMPVDQQMASARE
jgi:UrcA family protein